MALRLWPLIDYPNLRWSLRHLLVTAMVLQDSEAEHPAQFNRWRTINGVAKQDSRDQADSKIQNLIPLFLRPLRLCLSQEHLRRTRIVLLKITHAPYVGAIWAYEGLHDYWDGDHKGHGSSSLGGPGTHISTKRDSYLRYSAYTPRTLVASSLNQASGHAARAAGRSTTSLRPTTRASVEPQDDLKSLVVKLSYQVQELTAIVAEQQGKGQVEEGISE
jgi:hypothetical protein